MVRCGRDEEEEERIVASCSEEKEEKREMQSIFVFVSGMMCSVCNTEHKGKERTMVLNPRWHKERRSF